MHLQRLKFSKEKTGILATWGEKRCFIGPRSEEVKNNKRKEFASLFVDKREVSGRDAFDAISDSIPSSGFLSVDELGSVKCTQNDLNKYLKNELGVTTAIRSKSIDKAQRKTIFFINPNY